MEYEIQTNGEFYRVRYSDGAYLQNDDAEITIFGSKSAAEYAASGEYQNASYGNWVKAE